MDMQQQNTENMLIFILYLGAPLLIIFANVLTISLIFSKQQNTDIKQFSLLGFSLKDLLKIRFFESLIYTVTFFLSALICNIFISVATIEVAMRINSTSSISWMSVIIWPSLLAIIMLVALLEIIFFQLVKNKSNQLI